VASQLVQAAQLTFEGYFLQDAVGMSPMVMVGAEGVLGVAVMGRVGTTCVISLSSLSLSHTHTHTHFSPRQNTS
jgi:hypothetical protein